MTLESSEFFNNERIPSRFTCDSANVNPPLTIIEPPPESESLVIIMEDQSTEGGPWIHWLVWDINPLISDIQEDESPDGAMEGITSFGTTGYGGPCPSEGVHKYVFKLYALDTALGLTTESQLDEVLISMDGHIIEEAEPFVGYYSREK